MIITISHTVDSFNYKKSNQFNVFYRSVKFYRASVNIVENSIIIKFSSRDSATDWLNKYMLEFVEFQSYMIKFFGMTDMEINYEA